jgi:8-oxo-dGTP pyrophosphatase MutT (NUDIX family)
MSKTEARTAPSNLPSFDPRTVPVASVDGHLPPVSFDSLQPQAIRQRFLAPPSWDPEFRDEPSWSGHSPVPASVLIPVILRERPTVMLTQRTAHLSSHSGQIAFPGGKHDAGDVDMVATALREAWEEVGLAPEFVQILGTLPVYVTGSAFIITPVVGLVRSGFSLAPNADEVDEVFEVPLDFLMDPANHRRHSVMAAGVEREWLSMPYTDDRAERFIWGATAGMLRNFYRFLQA